MISGVGSQLASANVVSNVTRGAIQKPSDSELELKEKFQDFFAGTLYKQMFKSLRATHDKSEYLHGGQAEEMFRNQLDQQVAEDLAKNQGESFSNRFFEAFQANRRK
jgi:peptidoglycan hydrolase FlgJ